MVHWNLYPFKGMSMIGAVVIWNSSKAFFCADQIDDDNDARDPFFRLYEKDH